MGNASEASRDVEADDDWPQLSQLDLDVCLSATLPDDREAPPEPRPQR